MMGWKTKTLGEVVCKTPTVDPRKSPEKKILYVDVSGVSNATLEITEATELIGKDAPSRARRIISEGNVIFATVRPTLKRIAVVPSHLDGQVCSTGYFVFQPNEEIHNRYLYYFLQSDGFMGEMERMQAGASYPAVNDTQVKSTQIAYPPIPEQKRIVAILDQVFADIDKARTLTEQNLKNARELFESKLQEVFKTRGRSWERVSLLELLDRKWIVSHLDGNHGGDYPRKSEFVDSGVPYVSAKCLVDGEIDMTKAKYLSEDRAALLRKGIAKNDDVLFAHNATVGPVAILETDEDKIILGTSLTYYRCNKKFILPEYLSQYMITPEFTAQYTSIMRQSTRNQVPITKQREFIHVIPPVEEQADVARILSGLSMKIKSLEKNYMKKLLSLDELKKSILQKAFSGELTKEESKGAAA